MIRNISSRTLFRFSKYQQDYDAARYNPQQFWKEVAKDVKWGKFPQTILDDSRKNFFRWFPDGKINVTEQCLDRHLATMADTPAYYYESPITGNESQISYKELHARVSKLSDALQKQFKIKAGDRVIVYMPMVIESIIAQLACARIGAIHIVVFGGFAPHELATRIEDCSPELIICGNAGKEPNRVIDYLEIVDKSL